MDDSGFLGVCWECLSGGHWCFESSSGLDSCGCQLPALDSPLENWTLVLPELPCTETGHFTGLPSVSGV